MPKHFVSALIACLLIGGCAKVTDENVLETFAVAARESANAMPSPVSLEARLNRTPDKLLLRLRLRNISAEPLEMYPFELPWGNSNSLTIAAIGVDGSALKNIYPIDDPGPEHLLVIKPGEVLEGDFDLADRFSVTSLPPKEVLVLWLYRLPNHEGDTKASISGIVAIPPLVAGAAT